MQLIQVVLSLVRDALLEFWHFSGIFVLTIFISVLVQRLDLRGPISRLLRRRSAVAIAAGTGLGAVSPFCSCTVVPVIRASLRSGAPLSAVMPFWIAAPAMDPAIFTLSVALLGWSLAVSRLVAVVLISVAAGCVAILLERRGVVREVLKGDRRRAVHGGEDARGKASCCSAAGAESATASPPARGRAAASTTVAVQELIEVEAEAPDFRRSLSALRRPGAWLGMLRDVARDSVDLGRWLLLAFLLEGIIVRYVPTSLVAHVLGQHAILAVPLAALISVPVYVNNVSALPIVAGLLHRGMQPGAAITFLIAGSVSTIPAMVAVQSVVHRRVFWLHLLVGMAGAIVAGWIISVVI